MKTLITFFLLAFVFVNTSFPQATTTANCSATVLTPIAIAKIEDMNFGNVSASTSSVSVIITPSGSRSISDHMSLPSATGTVTAASFSIAGSGASTYAITLPSTALTLVSEANSMTVDNFTSTPSATGTLNAGTQTIYVGATLHIAGSQPAGVYLSSTPFEVAVNYN